MRDSSNHLLNRLLPDATDANGFIEWIYIYISLFFLRRKGLSTWLSIYVANYILLLSNPSPQPVILIES